MRRRRCAADLEIEKLPLKKLQLAELKHVVGQIDRDIISIEIGRSVLEPMIRTAVRREL